MNESLRDIVAEVREHVGLWIRTDHTFIRVTGQDACTWLHSLTTNDVQALESGQGQASAVLDRQGRLQAHFSLHRWEDEYWVIIEQGQTETLLAHLEAHLFIEEVSIEQTDTTLEQVAVQGPQTLPFLGAILDTGDSVSTQLLPCDPYGCHPIELLGHDVLAFQISLCGEDGYLFIVEQGEAEALIHAMTKLGSRFNLTAVTPEAQEVLRIEAGIPKFGIDVDTTHLIPETTLDRDAVSYDKGCYIGQEIVARLKAYGSPKRALVGLHLDATDHPPPRGAQLLINGQKVGQIKSVTYSPTLEATLALAFLDRDHRAPGSVYDFTAPDTAISFSARVALLPFYASASRQSRASLLYDQALQIFEDDLNDEDERAIELLKEAILLDPAYEDAYEAIGVILHRHQRIDEAIYYMKILADLNPDCIMAHTNLSVFFVAKGMIEEAEEEKAKSAVLQIQHASDDRQATELAEAERKRITEEALERIEMFNEVLDIDPEDAVATFGLGQAYIQLNRYDQAVPHLKKATEVQKDYSAAYLHLGKCHEFLGQPDEAVAVFEQGIRIASRKGDLMPMREMERRLKALENSTVGKSGETNRDGANDGY